MAEERRGKRAGLEREARRGSRRTLGGREIALQRRDASLEPAQEGGLELARRIHARGEPPDDLAHSVASPCANRIQARMSWIVGTRKPRCSPSAIASASWQQRLALLEARLIGEPRREPDAAPRAGERPHLGIAERGPEPLGDALRGAAVADLDKRVEQPRARDHASGPVHDRVEQPFQPSQAVSEHRVPRPAVREPDRERGQRARLGCRAKANSGSPASSCWRMSTQRWIGRQFSQAR